MTTDYVFQDPFGYPGINRDQTPFQTINFVDGQHVRWYNDQPRKMGGEFVCDLGTPQIVRGMFGAITGQQISFEPGVNAIHLYAGHQNSLSFFLLNNNGTSLSTIDVTPLVYIADPLNMWTFDQYSTRNEAIEVVNYIIAMVRPALHDISTNNPGQVFYGICGGEDRLLPLDTNLNGFVLAAEPFIFIGGQQGVLIWNNPDTFDFDPENFLLVSNTRLVAARQIRGGNALSILIWSITSLYRVTFNPNSPIDVVPFLKETITEETSIISQNCTVEVAAISTYFWIGQNCFYQYNGIVTELQNDYNKLWFFNNLNRDAAEKCWAYVDTAHNEVWFYGPLFGATECNHAVIYNYKLKCWYDTTSHRVAGINASFLSYPIKADSRLSNTFITTGGITYAFWMHEYGVDLEVNGAKYAIKSYFRTHDRMLARLAPNQDLQTRTRRFEPDIILEGQMKLQVYSKQFPDSDYEISREYLLRDPVTNKMGKVDMVNMGRIVSYYFESNEVGGFYQFGRSVIDIAPDGSERPSR